MASPGVLATLPILGGTTSGNSSEYANYLPILNSQGLLDSSFIDHTVITSDITAIKLAAKVVATSPITLSGTQTIDGVAVVAGDRVLVTAQASGPTNGIYVVASGAWTRSPDLNVTGDIVYGTLVGVLVGTTHSNTLWKCTTTGTITIGTTSIVFALFTSGGGSVTWPLVSTDGNLSFGSNVGTAAYIDDLGNGLLQSLLIYATASFNSDGSFSLAGDNLSGDPSGNLTMAGDIYSSIGATWANPNTRIIYDQYGEQAISTVSDSWNTDPTTTLISDPDYGYVAVNGVLFVRYGFQLQNFNGSTSTEINYDGSASIYNSMFSVGVEGSNPQVVSHTDYGSFKVISVDGVGTEASIAYFGAGTDTSDASYWVTGTNVGNDSGGGNFDFWNGANNVVAYIDQSGGIHPSGQLYYSDGSNLTINDGGLYLVYPTLNSPIADFAGRLYYGDGNVMTDPTVTPQLLNYPGLGSSHPLADSYGILYWGGDGGGHPLADNYDQVWLRGNLMDSNGSPGSQDNTQALLSGSSGAVWGTVSATVTAENFPVDFEISQSIFTAASTPIFIVDENGNPLMLSLTGATGIGFDASGNFNYYGTGGSTTPVSFNVAAPTDSLVITSSGVVTVGTDLQDSTGNSFESLFNGSGGYVESALNAGTAVNCNYANFLAVNGTSFIQWQPNGDSGWSTYNDSGGYDTFTASDFYTPGGGSLLNLTSFVDTLFNGTGGNVAYAVAAGSTTTLADGSGYTVTGDGTGVYQVTSGGILRANQLWDSTGGGSITPRSFTGAVSGCTVWGLAYGSGGGTALYAVGGNGPPVNGDLTPEFYALAVDIFADSSPIFYQTIDGGNTWQTPPPFLPGFTVATLPTPYVGQEAYVTDALAPTYATPVVGGGTTTIPVFFDGTNWICH